MPSFTVPIAELRSADGYRNSVESGLPQRSRQGLYGKMVDVHDIKLGMTAASAFAYIADGTGGMKIVQIFAPNDNPNYLGFSPRPTPKLIATYKTKGPALAISKGIDRDRGADESGNQVTVFNRRGSRPFNKEEMERMYLRNGQLYTVTNTPPGPAK